MIFILSDLSKLTITQSIKKIIEDDLMGSYFSEIGKLTDEVFSGATYDEIINFGTPVKGFSTRI